MNKDTCMKKVNEMADDIHSSIIKECDRLFQSGGIGTSEFNDDEYVLPKILLVVALEDIASQYKPPAELYDSEIDNLRHF